MSELAPIEVLVVDDDADIRQLVVELLRMSGYDARAVPSGVEALAEMRAGERPPPALVLLDVQMPELDGWSTLSALRTIEGLADLAVVLCTVKASPADVERGSALGCDGFLAKPFAITELIAVVRRTLELRNRERVPDPSR
jgi:CheY-like chemotaxis protein